MMLECRSAVFTGNMKEYYIGGAENLMGEGI